MNTNYAGFWLRFAAYLIDAIILSAVQFIAIVPILGVIGLNMASQNMDPESMTEAQALGMIATVMATTGTTIMIFVVLTLLYFPLMESSKYQGTIGKVVLGLVVTDENGHKVTFLRSLGRNLGKIISSMIFYIGYIMIGFTQRKQGLHDMLAKTLVVKKAEQTQPV